VHGIGITVTHTNQTLSLQRVPQTLYRILLLTMSRRVAITAVGVCSSLGCSGKQIIDSLKKGRTSFVRPSFDEQVVISPILDFNIKAFTGPFKDRRYLNRGGQFCVASAVEAIRDSGIKRDLLSDAGLFMGTGPNLDIGGEFPEILDGKMDRKDLMALWMLRFLPNTAASAIAMYSGIHGENLTINTACAASLMAVGEAFRKIRDGYLDLAFAGGGDSRLSRGGILAYKKANAIYTGKGEPDTASRPFDSRRKGFVPGEGGAVFLLEEMTHAERRGATIYAEICGFSGSIDGHNMTAPEPTATWAEKAVRGAMDDAGVNPRDIDIISSHGTGTPLNDQAEACLLHRVFGDDCPPVIALKSWIGHGAAACGALELAIVLVCMHNNYLPETRNLHDPCHMDLNFVLEKQAYFARTVLLENFGFGGQNGALIIKNAVTG
jgi:3-oxoacyl-[acyl-carrier-protein] synthase II